jgi:diacylglycerol kinase (ATP)
VKRIAIILNGISRRKNFFYRTWLPVVNQRFNVQVFETEYSGHATTLTSTVIATDFDVIVAAGGDGTLSQVVNGIIASGTLPGNILLALLPLGSGNDFARTTGATSSPVDFLAMIEANRVQHVNVGQIDYTRFNGQAARSFFVNVADVGMGPEVVRRAGRFNNRILGATINYYKSIVATFFSYKPMIVHADADWKWSGTTRSLAVANGKFYGHGLCVAPEADPADDVFNVFICGDVSVFDFIRFSPGMKNCERVPLEEVKYRTATRIVLTAEETCLIEGDGEVLGVLPASIGIHTQKVAMLTPKEWVPGGRRP